MDCDTLRDDQWDRIKGFVPGAAPRANAAHARIIGLFLERACFGWRVLAVAGVICPNGSATTSP